MKITLFTKRNKITTNEVIQHLEQCSNELIVYEGTVGDDFPEEANNSSPDILISYISPWIIPKKVLNNTKLYNINFHPGGPDYPGIGCFNFAIYNNEPTYAVTSHVMEEKVDIGKIISVKRFELLESDTVYSLSIKSYENMLSLFNEVMDYIIKNKRLPICEQRWERKPYTRKELEELCVVTPDMTRKEIEKRIKSTTYPGMPGAYIELFGKRFEYNPER